MTKNIYKSLCLLGITLILSGFAKAQTPPNAFNYSAVARNAAGQPIASAKIGIQISILKTSTTGAVQYSENHTVTTDAFGLFNLAIGEGTVQSGSMSTITWGTDKYYIKIGMDVAGGTNFLTMGTTQLMSVPYALQAKNASNGIDHISSDTDTLYLSNGKFFVAGSKVNASNSGGKTYIELFGDVTDAQADSTLKADLGPNTQFIYITNTTKLTTVDLSAVKTLMELKITGNIVLVNVNASPLQRCSQIFQIDSNPLLANLITDKLSYVGNLSISLNDKLSALNFPVLKKSLKFIVTNNKIVSTLSAGLLSTATFINIRNNGLTSLSFPALTSTSDNLIIEDNTLLSTISIESITTAFGISISSSGITSLSLPVLKTLNSSLSIVGNSKLTTLTAISLTNAFGITIRNNGLTSLSFPALTTLIGDLSIEGNTSLNTLTASSLTTADYIVVTNNGLTSLSLPALTTLTTTIRSGLNIDGNASLSSLTASSLTSVFGITIRNNGLTSLSFPGITSLNGGLYIEGNASLITLTANSLNSIGRFGGLNYISINIKNNGLMNLSFPALTTLSGGLNIEDNIKLTSLTASSLKTIGSGGGSGGAGISDFSINIKNNGLTSLSFPSLTTLSSGLSILGNALLTVLNTNSLITAQSISIQNNGLTSLSFPALTTLTGDFIVTNNTSLKTLNISALSKILRLDASQNKLSDIIWASQINNWIGIDLQANTLPSLQINKILSLIVAAGSSARILGNGSNELFLHNQTPKAPPTGQGLTDKTTINGWGNGIYVNTDY